MNPVMKGTTFPRFVKNKIHLSLHQIWFLMNWTPLPKLHFGGAIDRINHPDQCVSHAIDQIALPVFEQLKQIKMLRTHP